MAKRKKIEFELKEIKVSFSCSKCEKVQEVVVDEYAFSHYEAECKLCGSHGALSVDVTCPDCKTSREIEISSF